MTTYIFGDCVGTALAFFYKNSAEITGLDCPIVHEVIAFPNRKRKVAFFDREVAIIYHPGKHSTGAHIFLRRPIDRTEWNVLRATGWKKNDRYGYLPTLTEPASSTAKPPQSLPFDQEEDSDQKD